MGLQRVTILLLLVIVMLPDVENAQRRGRSRRPSRIRRQRLISTEDGRRLEQKLRLGIAKSGVGQWSASNPHMLARIRSEPRAPVGIAAVRPQLNGGFGNNDAPRRLRARQQYRPNEYVSPNRNARSRPAALTRLNETEKNLISTEFFIKYHYVDTSSNRLTDRRDLIVQMQRNYGIPQTGELDGATITAMMSPRCGVPDGPAAYSLFPNKPKWQNTDVTYAIKGYSPDMSQCQIRNIFKRAFRVWEEVTDLTFSMVDRDDADIIIYFGYEEHGDGYPFDGSNGLLAHAFTPGTSAISGDSHFDEAEFWTLGKGRVFDTYNGNSGGKPCVFPFYFQDEEYNTCTTAGRQDGLEWCATTGDYDRDGQYAFCPHELLFTYGGNGDNDPCKFPFVFQGNQYTECTQVGRSDGYSWCATTFNYDTDGRWGFCPSRAHATSGGNAAGGGCVFPFIFQKQSYSQCTTVGRSDYQLWCATTADYDADGKWGFCEGEGYSLFLVATHEFGHAIGLDHSNLPGALMYPSYSYTADFELPEDDKSGVQELYGGPRRRPLPPLKLETCGGDLGITETATTSRPPISTTQTTRSRRPTPTVSTTAPRTTRRPTRPTVVDRCDSSNAAKPTSICQLPIDTVMTYQDQYFVFQGPWLWVVTGRGKSQTQRITTASAYWRNLNCGADAAYQRTHDEKLTFFKGSKYYLYRGSTIMPGYPKSVTHLGLPPRTIVDAVVLMPTRHPVTRAKETRLYYFVGNKVYRANPQNGQVMQEMNPTTLAVTRAWEDLPSSVDAVFRERLGKPYTIFVKGKKYYRYQNAGGKVDFAKRNIKKIFRCKAKEPRIALPLFGGTV